MSDEEELIDLQISERAQICVAKLQEVFAEFDLVASDGIMAASEFFAWAHILGLMPIGKNRMLNQMDRSAASAREWANSHFDGFKARAELLAALEAGESGGRLQ